MTTLAPTLVLKRSLGYRCRAFLALAALLCCTHALAEAPATQGGVSPALSGDELQTLVGPIALYPDDLVAIILPAATNPLQIVQADRFLEKRKTNTSLPLDEKWDDAVKSLLNYPEVVKTMSNDLEWTTALGEAVATDQGAVLEAVQVFRRKTQSAGNLKSDTKQTIVVEKEVIKIVPADPQVIYVPQYNPSTVVVYGGYSTWSYWPSPYPVYYYPYPPGAALATGLIWGAAIGSAWNGGHYHADYHGGNANINIDRSTNINVNRSGSANTLPAAKSTQWKPSTQPGQVGRTSGTATPHVGYEPPPNRGSGSMASQRPSTQPSDRSRSGSTAFGDYGSGRQTQMDSSRGAASRNAMSGAGSRQTSLGGASGGRRGGRR